MRHQIVKRMPRGLGFFFPEIEAIYIVNCGLEHISSDDLQGLPNLKVLDLINNNLRVLESDLFKYNPLVKSFSVAENPIKHVGHNIFHSLLSLSTVSFRATQCIERDILQNRDAIKILIFDLTVSCPPTKSTEMPCLDKSELIIEDESSSKVELLTRKVSEMESLLMELAKRMLQLEGKSEVSRNCL